MKKKLLLCLSIIVLLGASCKEETTIEVVYSYGIHEYREDIADFVAINNYLTDRGLLAVSKVFKGETEAETDKKAIDLFEKNVAKINENELALLVKKKTSFIYGLAKGSSEAEDDKPFLREKEYKFNQ
jgi:hypothetical protein